MKSKNLTLDQIAAVAEELPPADRVRLIEHLARTLYGCWIAPEHQPSRSLLGVAAHLGPAPSAEEIDEARREMWGEYMGKDDRA